MAQGGHYSGLDEDESEDTEEFVPLPFMDPFIMGLKKEGDEKFQAKLYKEAAAIYTMAMNFPVYPFMDTTAISEKLFRKRATCFFKLGKYIDAIEDSERALEMADCMNNKNLIAQSIFIKMKAIVCLGDFVAALPLAVWCKHLRPSCAKTKTALDTLKDKLREGFREDNSLIREVLVKMLRFANMLSMNKEARELALESYTELLELLNFMPLPGVLLKQAECLLKLGRCKEAKDICANVLWLRPGDLEALELMANIVQRLKESEMEQVEEMKMKNEIEEESQAAKLKPAAASTQKCRSSLSKVESQESRPKENLEEVKTNNDALMNFEEKAEELKIPCTPKVEEANYETVAINVQENMVAVDQMQDNEAAAKDHGQTSKKKSKKNKQKKKKKKAKKKAQRKQESSSGPATLNNTKNESPDESPDEDDSQATNSIIGDQDVDLDSSDFANTAGEETSFGTLPITLSMLEANQDVDVDDGDFIPVRNSRRIREITPDVQFRERVSGLDWIGASCAERHAPNHDAITKPNSQYVDDLSKSRARQTSFASATAIAKRTITKNRFASVRSHVTPRTESDKHFTQYKGFV